MSGLLGAVVGAGLPIVQHPTCVDNRHRCANPNWQSCRRWGPDPTNPNHSAFRLHHHDQWCHHVWTCVGVIVSLFSNPKQTQRLGTKHGHIFLLGAELHTVNCTEAREQIWLANVQVLLKPPEGAHSENLRKPLDFPGVPPHQSIILTMCFLHPNVILTMCFHTKTES